MRKKKPIDSKKKKLRSCSTDREWSRFVLESGQLAFLESGQLALYIKCLKSFFTVLFMIGRAVDRPLYHCVYRDDGMCGCEDTAISVGDHCQS